MPHLRLTNVDLVAQELRHQARPGDLTVVYPWFCGISFQRYHPEPEDWISIPNFDEHLYHTHNLIKEKMIQGEATGPELDRIKATLQAGRRVWLVGGLPFLRRGEMPVQLLPAPTGPGGWKDAPYIHGWGARVAYLIQSHARTIARVPVHQTGPVNPFENLPLFVVEGWHDEP
jgi:hypothetical protein